ncbi:MAG: hypothetical protein IKC05_10520, partial [Lentisphaeria bacterium]|nr:hypothetical protein [Lentisphaeria bacterium]
TPIKIITRMLEQQSSNLIIQPWNLDTPVINPLAAVGAAGMMLDFLGEKEAAAAIDRSIAFITGNKMKSQAAGKMGYSTGEVGDLVVENL